MDAFIYYITLPFIYFISILPFWWLYRFSDFLFFITYYVVGYRKKVVISNLRNSFPEKSEEEIRMLQRNFYRYFCDVIVETIKTLSISPETLKKRIPIKAAEIVQKYFDENRSIVIVMGHWGNWELGGARFAVEPLHKLFVLYHPLHNQYFDRLIYKMRTRLGNGLYAMNDALRGVLRDKDQLTGTVFIADQTPSTKDTYWMEFLHQDTPVFLGTGKIAKKMNYPVIYSGVRRIKRGSYEIYFKELVSDPSEMEANEIVALFMNQLEKDIREIPEAWLWSHRRWKHKRNG